MSRVPGPNDNNDHMAGIGHKHTLYARPISLTMSMLFLEEPLPSALDEFVALARADGEPFGRAAGMLNW